MECGRFLSLKVPIGSGVLRAQNGSQGGKPGYEGPCRSIRKNLRFAVITEDGDRVGPVLRHTRHTAIRNMSDAGLEERRIMDVFGHVTRSMFDRYNIGKEQDVEEARRAIEQFHRKAQKRK